MSGYDGTASRYLRAYQDDYQRLVSLTEGGHIQIALDAMDRRWAEFLRGVWGLDRPQQTQTDASRTAGLTPITSGSGYDRALGKLLLALCATAGKVPPPTEVIAQRLDEVLR